MTNLRDLLHDLIEDTIKMREQWEKENGKIVSVRTRQEAWEDDKEELLDEYIDTIKERWIG